MVCLTLLLIAGSFCSYKISGMLSYAKRQKAVKIIESHVDLCQKLSALKQTDMILKLRYDEDDLICEMGEELGLGFYKNPKLIKHSFSGISFTFSKKDQDLEFTFSSTGTVTPTGKLIFHSNDGEVIKEIWVTNRYITREKEPPRHPFDTKAFKQEENKLI